MDNKYDLTDKINNWLFRHNDYIDHIGTNHYVFPKEMIHLVFTEQSGHIVNAQLTSTCYDSDLKSEFDEEKPYFALTDEGGAVSLSLDEVIDYLEEFYKDVLDFEEANHESIRY